MALGSALVTGGAGILGGLGSVLLGHALRDEPEVPELPRPELKPMEVVRSEAQFRPVSMPSVAEPVLPESRGVEQGGVFAGFQPDPAPVFQPAVSRGFMDLLRMYG